MKSRFHVFPSIGHLRTVSLGSLTAAISSSALTLALLASIASASFSSHASAQGAAAAPAQRTAGAAAPAVAPDARPARGAELQRIKAELLRKLPQLRAVDAIEPAPVAGWFEVRTGGSIFYVDASVKHLFVRGSLLDADTREDLTRKSLQRASAVSLADLDPADAIRLVKTSGKTSDTAGVAPSRVIAVFADPNCGFCKAFERTLESVQDVEIRVYLIPILGESSQEISRDIWCAPQPQQAWSDWMLRNVRPASRDASCDTSAIDRNVAVARRYAISGTPTTIFASGARMPGALSREDIDRALAGAATAR